MAKACSRCGRCCLEAKVCSFRAYFARDRKASFEGRCELLVDLPDGTTSCEAIEHAIKNDVEWYEPGRLWIVNEFVGRGCEIELAAEAAKESADATPSNPT